MESLTIADLTVRIHNRMGNLAPLDDEISRFAGNRGTHQIGIYYNHELTFDPLAGAEVYNQIPVRVHSNDQALCFSYYAPWPNELQVAAKIALDGSRMEVCPVGEFHINQLKTRPRHNATLCPSDQPMLIISLHKRQAVIMHACGAIWESGLAGIFVGPSGAGKTTLSRLIMHEAELLCDDRVIVQIRGEQAWACGTWIHGDLARVSNGQALLGGVFFLHQADNDRIVRVRDQWDCFNKLQARVARLPVHRPSMANFLETVQRIVNSVPCYDLYFTRTGRISELIRERLIR